MVYAVRIECMSRDRAGIDTDFKELQGSPLVLTFQTNLFGELNRGKVYRRIYRRRESQARRGGEQHGASGQGRSGAAEQ